MSGASSAARVFIEYALTRIAVATDSHGAVMKPPPRQSSGAKPTACTAPSSPPQRPRTGGEGDAHRADHHVRHEEAVEVVIGVDIAHEGDPDVQVPEGDAHQVPGGSAGEDHDRESPHLSGRRAGARVRAADQVEH